MAGRLEGNYTQSRVPTTSEVMSSAMQNFNKSMQLQDERELQRDALKRQALIDAQNKQMFDLKMDAAKKEEQMAKDKEAYLKGVAQPGAYGLKVGTEDIINALGEYGTPEGQFKAPLDIQSLLDRVDSTKLFESTNTKKYEDMNPLEKAARDQEIAKRQQDTSKLYNVEEQQKLDEYFKGLEQFGNLLTGTGLDDRTVGYSLSNPNNIYAAEERLKAEVGRQSALDTEAKNIANKIEGLELAKIKAGAPTTTKGTAKTAGGYSVKDPGSVIKDVYSMFKTQHGLKSDQAIHGEAAKLAANMAKQGYDASQIVSTLNSAYTPAKDIPWGWDQKESFQTTPLKESPKNVAYTAPTDTGAYDSFRKAYETKLKDIETQRSGKSGMAELYAITNGKTGSVPAKDPINDEVSKIKQEFVEKQSSTAGNKAPIEVPESGTEDTMSWDKFSSDAKNPTRIPLDEINKVQNLTGNNLINFDDAEKTKNDNGEYVYNLGGKYFIVDSVNENTKLKKGTNSDNIKESAKEVAKKVELQRMVSDPDREYTEDNFPGTQGEYEEYKTARAEKYPSTLQKFWRDITEPGYFANRVKKIEREDGAMAAANAILLDNGVTTALSSVGSLAGAIKYLIAKGLSKKSAELAAKEYSKKAGNFYSKHGGASVKDAGTFRSTGDAYNFYKKFGSP